MNSQRGSAMLVTMIVIAALLGGAAVLVSMQLSANRSTELSRTGMESLHCAEAGLAAARATVKAHYGVDWNTAIAASAAGNTSEPAWLLAGFSHDLDGDGVTPDFSIYLKDNDDEGPPTANNLGLDEDQRVFVVSKCNKYADTPKQVEELVQYSGGNNCGYSEDGGCDGNGSFAQ
jgi:hypothetical protein